MTLVHDYSETLNRRKWKCDICQTVDYWGPTWSQYGSIAMEDGCPEDIPTVCSDYCMRIFDGRLRRGEIKLPKLSKGGPAGYKILRPRKGY